MTCGRTIEVEFDAADGPKRLKLDPWSAYMFISKKKIGLDLLAIDLVGKSPGDRDVPKTIPQVKPLKVKVKLLVDDSERRTQPVWSAALKKRLGEASEIMLRQTGVSFEVVECDDWSIDANVTDLRSALVDFEKQVKLDSASLAIGFTSHPFAPPMGKPVDGRPVELPFAMSRGMFAPYILIREGDPRTEPERVEVLVQQLGRFLGGVPSPDPFSAMRSKLGDGKAIHAKFKIGFDPLNGLVLNLVADELRKGPAKKLADWPDETQVRLARLYATISAATPDESLNDEVMALLDRAGLRGAAIPEPKPKEPNGVEAPKSHRAITAEQEAIRKVIKAIVVKAEENAKKPAAARVKGDELTELYIRAAADVAYTLEPDLRKKAFLVALGIALDDSEMVRKLPTYSGLWKACESDDERKVRIAVLGNPSVRFRRDLCQHFAISAALTAIEGTARAEALGLAKEVADMTKKGGSGFDFSDLVGDFAGVEFANLVLANGEKLNTIRQKFVVADYVPEVEDLADGLTEARFNALYGSTSDKRFTDAVDSVRKRVKALKAYQTKKEN
jgi:hypothetical protein